MGEPGFPRAKLLGKSDGFTGREMGPMRLGLEAVEDEQVDPGEETFAFLVQFLGVGNVGKEPLASA